MKVRPVGEKRKDEKKWTRVRNMIFFLTKLKQNYPFWIVHPSRYSWVHYPKEMTYKVNSYIGLRALIVCLNCIGAKDEFLCFAS